MEDMGKSELTPMVAVDPFHLPQSEPLALTVNNKEKEFRQEQEKKEQEEEEEVNFKRSEEKKPGFTFTVGDDNGENQSFTLQVPTPFRLKCFGLEPSHPIWPWNSRQRLQPQPHYMLIIIIIAVINQVLQLDVLEEVPTKDPLADASNNQMRWIVTILVNLWWSFTFFSWLFFSNSDVGDDIKML